MGKTDARPKYVHNGLLNGESVTRYRPWITVILLVIGAILVFLFLVTTLDTGELLILMILVMLVIALSVRSRLSGGDRDERPYSANASFYYQIQLREIITGIARMTIARQGIAVLTAATQTVTPGAAVTESPQSSVMDIIGGAAITIRRAILERVPSGQ